jgi:hypothetical protein
MCKLNHREQLFKWSKVCRSPWPVDLWRSNKWAPLLCWRDYTGEREKGFCFVNCEGLFSLTLISISIPICNLQYCNLQLQFAIANCNANVHSRKENGGSVFVHHHTRQVEPSDLPAYDQLQSCSLWYSLHYCVKFLIFIFLLIYLRQKSEGLL